MSDLELLVITIRVLEIKDGMVQISAVNETRDDQPEDVLWLAIGDSLAAHINADIWDRPT